MTPKGESRATTIKVPAVLPSGRVRGYCRDCYTWIGARGSAHDTENCPLRGATIARAQVEAHDARQRLADLSGEPS